MTERKRSHHDRPSRWRSLIAIVSGAVAASVYLFVTAPPPLAAGVETRDAVPIRSVFAMLDAENHAARALWTEDIVNRGKSVGLVFDEAWRDDAVHAGPLPALFLRETARNLEKTSLRLSLFLGSPFPINPANKFSGAQAEKFAALEATHAPQFFFEPSTQRYTAMFADTATSDACVTCHNEHASSPKHDWKLHAMMGATTWMYPEASVSRERALEMIATLRKSIRAAYASYLAKVKTFPQRPEIGEKWPRDGFFLPTEDAFMRELARRASATTLGSLMDPAAPVAEVEPPPAPAPRPPRSSALVIRAATSASVIIDRAGSRVMVARIPAGASTSLSLKPPLHVTITDRTGLSIEYGGAPVALPETAGSTAHSEDVDVTLVGPVRERS